MSDVDDELNLDKLRADLRQTEDELPPEIVQRLQAARREAVSLADERQASQWTSWLNWQRMAAVGAMASVAFALAIVLQSPSETLPFAAGDELAAAQEAELLEDLEFVAWMVALEDEETPTSG